MQCYGQLRNLQLKTAEEFLKAATTKTVITDEMKVLQSNYHMLKAIEDLSKTVFPNSGFSAIWLESGDPSPLDLLKAGEFGAVLSSLVSMKESKENNGD